MSDTNDSEELMIPETEVNLPENTPSNPSPTAFVVHNPNVSSRLSHLNSSSSHSVPVNLPPYPFPKDDIVDYTKNPPAKYNNNIALKDEYLQVKFDPLGEKKISKNGFFKDPESQKKIVVSTFTLPGKGKKLYVMATDISKELQFRDSYLFIHKNKSLLKYLTSDADKAFLIKHGILQSVFKSRTIGVVTFRSLYLIYGARLLKGGKRLVDDYWEQLGKDEGFTENDPVFNMLSESSSHGHHGRHESVEASKLAGGISSDASQSDLYKDYSFSRASGAGTISRNDLRNRKQVTSGNFDASASSLINKVLYSDLYSNVPIPVSVENHPLITNSKFKEHQEPDYRINYSHNVYLDNLLLQEATDELKQNYLLSSGITNTPVFSKPAVSYNYNQLPYNNNVTITSPGGSTPQSITSSLLNNESLISSNGDNIYYVSCLQSQDIAGTINLSKNNVMPNYKLVYDHNKQPDKSRIDEIISSVPVTNDDKLLNEKSHVGLKFFDTNNVINKVESIQKSESNGSQDTDGAQGLVEVKHESVEFVTKGEGDDTGAEMELQGQTSGIKKIRNLEYEHNAISLNQNINNYNKLRGQQWKYYWFAKSGGFDLFKKNLKKKIIHEEQKTRKVPPTLGNTATNLPNNQESKTDEKPEVVGGDYFKYYVTPKSSSGTTVVGDSLQNPDVVHFNLNEDSDEEVIDEKVGYLPVNYALTPLERANLEKQKQELISEYRKERQQKKEQEQKLKQEGEKAHSVATENRDGQKANAEQGQPKVEEQTQAPPQSQLPSQEFHPENLEFQNMLRIRTIKRRKPNPNAVAYMV